ncbi:WD40 repeat domain-containing protein, partial [Fulvivirga sp. RKSG066]
AALLAKQDAEQQRIRAEAGEASAERNAALAEEKRIEAEKNEQLAKVREREAIVAKAAADRLRYLALGKAMGLKSTQLRTEQKELKGLLAQHAYLFNSKYEGDPYDNDIYDGLYYAIKELDDPLVKSLEGHEKGIRTLTSSPNGNLVFSADTEGKILKWSLQGERRVADTLASSRRQNHVVRSLAVTSDNSRLIAGGEFNRGSGASYVEILQTSGKNEPKQLDGFEGSVWNLIITPDDQGFYTLDKGGKSIKYSNFNEVNEVATSNIRLNDIALSNDGNYIIAAGNNGKIYLFDTQRNFAQSEIYNNGAKVLNIATSQDNQVAIGDETGLIKVFKLFGNQGVTRLVGHSSPIEAIEFSRDGRFIATASRDKTVRLWNRKRLNAQPITLKDHPDWVFSIAFTPNGQQILAGTKETVVRAWPTNIEVMTDKICSKIDRNMTEDEWQAFVGDDVPYEKTCQDK